MYKYTIPSNTKKRTKESEPTIGKLANDLDVTASPCHLGNLLYSTTQFPIFDPSIFRTFIPTRALASP